jgi:hypothetical protein
MKEDYIIFKHVSFDGEEIEMKVPNAGADIYEVVESFKRFLIAMSYHPDTVSKALNEDDDEMYTGN